MFKLRNQHFIGP